MAPRKGLQIAQAINWPTRVNCKRRRLICSFAVPLENENDDAVNKNEL